MAIKRRPKSKGNARRQPKAPKGTKTVWYRGGDQF